MTDELDPRWNKIGREALRIRETPDAPSLYDGHAERGLDLIGLLTWIVADPDTEVGYALLDVDDTIIEVHGLRWQGRGSCP